MTTLLKHYGISHGGVRPLSHPRLGVEINGQTCIRYLRFLRPVQIDHLELALISGTENAPFGGSGRWAPDVPTHPAHLIISVLDEQTGRWRLVKEVSLPANPVISGEGLSQEMTAEQMTAILDRAKDETRHIIALDGLRTDHLRVECDREHPVWPSHGEMNGGPFNVPFSLLNPLQAFGERLSDALVSAVHTPLLKQEAIQPEPPRGMEVIDSPSMLLYRGDRFAVGFSLRRPMLMHLGWDAFDRGRAGENRLADTILHLKSWSHGSATGSEGLSGPSMRTLSGDYGAHLWTGEVSVEANRVSYRNLRPGVDGLSIDAVFTIESDRLLLELTQHCLHAMPVLEFEAWRLAWDNMAAITGAVAMPTLLPGRNGDVSLPMLWGTSGPGCLACRVVDEPDDAAHMQIESYRCEDRVTGGWYLGPRPDLESVMMIPAGTRRATLEMVVTELGPEGIEGAPQPGQGVAECWAAPFACFRPEFAGFSDHSISANCHMNQADPIEVICLTRKPDMGPDPVDLARFTVGRAMMDGPGYGYYRELFLDTDPQLVMAAGRIHQVRPDLAWLRQIEPGLLESVSRMLAALDAESLVCSRSLSGNTGSFRWSSNSMDVIGFGHQDAYVNALSYRGFRNAAALLTDVGRHEQARQCREAAAGIQASYARTFLNPETGWIAGWRSRDGQLHDYAFTYINGSAISVGLLDDDAARTAMLNLEELRKTLGLQSARLGLPMSLLPLDPGDHLMAGVAELVPSFEHYIDGTLTGWANQYLRALSCYGLQAEAERLARDMDDAYAWGVFDGGNHSGTEFRSWEGMATGYEGTMGNLPYGTLYALAIEQGVLKPLEPEWWPAGG